MKTLFGDLADGDVHLAPFEAEERRQDGDEQPRVDREEQHLEDRVKGDQAGTVLAVAARELIPDDDHGDAAGQTDHDQPDHVLGLVGKEGDGEEEHQDRPDDPVLDQGQGEDLEVAEDPPHLFVAHLGQRRVHHQDEADGDRDVGGPDREPVPEVRHPRPQPPQPTPTIMARKIHSVR